MRHRKWTRITSGVMGFAASVVTVAQAVALWLSGSQTALGKLLRSDQMLALGMLSIGVALFCVFWKLAFMDSEFDYRFEAYSARIDKLVGDRAAKLDSYLGELAPLREVVAQAHADKKKRDEMVERLAAKLDEKG